MEQARAAYTMPAKPWYERLRYALCTSSHSFAWLPKAKNGVGIPQTNDLMS